MTLAHEARQHLAQRGFIGVIAAGLLLPLLLALPLTLAPRLLQVRDPLGPADAIIVLGGDASTRPAAAARAYRQHLAPVVLVSGTGDCRTVARLLVRHGVPPDRLMIECRSRTTRENALFAWPIVQQHGWHHAILVTSWQHSGRAVATFRREIPDLAITSDPTEPPRGLLPVNSLAGVLGLYEEYAKSAGYCLAFRICS